MNWVNIYWQSGCWARITCQATVNSIGIISPTTNTCNAPVHCTMGVYQHNALQCTTVEVMHTGWMQFVLKSFSGLELCWRLPPMQSAAWSFEKLSLILNPVELTLIVDSYPWTFSSLCVCPGIWWEQPWDMGDPRMGYGRSGDPCVTMVAQRAHWLCSSPVLTCWLCGGGSNTIFSMWATH